MFLPFGTFAANTFSASYNNSSLDADFGLGSVTASNDGTAASLVSGYGLTGQAAQVLSGQTLKYPTSGNLATDKGRISLEAKIENVFNGDNDTGHFYNLADIAYDSASEYLFIADTTNHRIVKTKIDGTGWVSYGSFGSGVGNFNTPTGISYDSASKFIYVTDTANHRIVKTKIDGTGWESVGGSGTEVGKFSSPVGIQYVPSTSYLYVADTANHRIVKTQFDTTGWTTYGTTGTGAGNFSSPRGISYDAAADYIYVADTNNERIVKTKIDGTGWTTYGSSGTGVGKFGANGPSGIFYDSSSSYIYVTDTTTGRIVKTQIDGTGWANYGTAGAGTGNFSSPRGISFDSGTGNIYVADYTNYRVVKTQIDGTGWTAYGTNGGYNGSRLRSPYDLEYNDVDGYLYIVDYASSRLFKVKPDGTGWSSLGGYGNQSNRFNAPTGLDIDTSSGYIYVADKSNNRIVKTKMDGTGWTTLGGFTSPTDVAYDPSTDYMYVTDTGNNRIVKTKISGSGWSTYGSYGQGIGRFNSPYGIHYDPATQYLLITDYINQRIIKTKFDGTGWTTLGGSYATTPGLQQGKFYNPYNLSYDHVNDIIYVVDTSGTRIVKTKIDGTGWTNITPSLGANPYGVDYNSTTGKIYISDSTNSQIKILSANDYSAIGTIASGSLTGMLSNPRGVYYDSANDDYYIADYTNYRIVKTKLDGSSWSTYGSYCSATCTQSGQFNAPVDVYFDASSGYLYVLEASTSYSRIIKTKMDGSVWTSYGAYSTTSGTGKFYQPVAFDYDPASGYFYVVNLINALGRPSVVKTQFDGTGWTDYGTYGTGSGQFSNPQAIDYDSASDYMYIADTNNERIVKTKIDGTGWTTYGTSGAGVGNFGADGLKGISYDPATGYIYLGDSVNNRVVKTQIDGTGWKTFGVTGKLDGMFTTPTRVLYDTANHKLIVSDYANNRVVKFSDGGDWTTYGSSGSGEGNFSSPSGISYDSSSGYFYVADTANHRIVKTKIDGTGWTAYGSSGSGEGNFSSPAGIAYDSSSGYFYVADTANHRIVKTKIDGTGWTAYGSSGSGEGNFSSPAAVYYDSASDYLYVADTANHRIVKTKIDGTGWATYGTSGSGIGGLNSPSDVYYDSSSQYMYIADTNNYRVVKTKFDGTGWKQFGTYTGTCTTIGAYMCQPKGVKYDSASDMVYATSNHRITKFKMDYSYYTLVSTGTLGSGIEQFSTPKGIFYDTSSGYSYVADSGNNRITGVKIGADNWSNIGKTYYTQTGNMSNVYGNFYDSASDTMYIADSGNHRIVKAKMDGSSWTFLGGPTAGLGTNGTDPKNSAVGYFNAPSAVYYDSSSEYIYVADTSNNRVIKTKIDGSGWTAIGGTGTGVGQLTGPKGVWYDAASDYLFITDTNNERIVKTKIDGTGWTTYGSLGSGTGNFASNNSVGITYDPASEYIYVADTGNNRIVKTKIDGTGWTTYGTLGTGVGNFNNPYGISYDSASEMIYVADYLNNRIVKTKIDGTGWTSMVFNSAIGIRYCPTNGLTYVADYSGLRVARLKFDEIDSSTATMSDLVFFQSEGDGVRLEANPISGTFKFYPAYNANPELFVASEPLNFDSGSWHDIKAWYNQPDGQLKLTVDGVDYTGTGIWSEPSYGTYFYVGSNTSGGETLSSAIDELKILNVYSDTDNPTNPTGVTGYSAPSGTQLTDNSWYSYQTTGPYFVWTGASDIGSGISGYFVYFGTNSSANPITEGTFQTANTYQNTSALSSGLTYYLRVAAKDNDNHTATGTTLFTYNFDTVSPSIPDHITVDPAGCSYSEPYNMTWPASSDASSDVAGYEYKSGSSGEIQSTTHLTADVNHYQDNVNFFYVRAKDSAGNVSGWQSAQYCYALDSDPPTNPTSITALNQDGGVTTLTSSHWYNFPHPKFSWSGATDNVGVAGYYVYFGTDADADPEDDGAYQTETSYIASPGTSGSTYYLKIKAKDLASLPATSTWEAFTYMYSTNVPSNPTTLVSKNQEGGETSLTSGSWYNYATPNFSWSGASGGQGVAGYYVYFGTNAGADPEYDGIYQTAASFTPSSSLTSGQTYRLKIKSRDNAGNPASETWSPFNYLYDGTAPSTPEYVTVSPSGCSTTSLFTMTWPASTDSESGLEQYEYKKGSLGTVYDLTDLSKQVTAYQEGDNIFYIRATDNAGNASSWQTGVFCSTGTIHVVDGPNVEPGPSSINVTWTSSKATTSSVKVYQGNTYVSEQGQVSYSLNHEVKVIGLKSEEDYRYQLNWSDQNGNLGESEWFSITTNSVPQIENLKAEVQNPYKVNVTWQTNYPASAKLEYGLNNSYDKSVALDSTTQDFSKLIDNLTPGSVYTMRVLATTTDGAEFSSGLTFQTPPMPSISGLKIEPVTDQAAATEDVSWTSNVEITTSLFYGIKGESSKTENSKADKALEHKVTISDLTDNTEYELYASGIDQYGNTARSETVTFKTANDTRPPKILAISIETSNVGLGQEDKARAAVSYKTDEVTSCIVEYAEGIGGDSYTGKTPQDETFINSHLTIVSDLKPSLPYHLRIVCHDRAGNQVLSSSQTIISGEAPKSVFNIIVKTLSSIFGWLNLFKTN